MVKIPDNLPQVFGGVDETASSKPSMGDFGMIIPAGKKPPAPADPGFDQPTEDSHFRRPIDTDARKLQQQLGASRAEDPNYIMAILGGAAAALLGATVWATFAYVTGIQIGFMAIGVGILVGHAVRIFGHGSDASFGLIGATLAAVGCLTGDIFMVCQFIAEQQGMGTLEVLSRINLNYAIKSLAEYYSFIDIIFYSLALFYGFKYAFDSDA
ncbi:MAG: hypothetical protein KAT79_05220 [candidate division Zixibacteria bacterium]|nr:hypothetical protein [candidate division Zixibacteria bacterium]